MTGLTELIDSKIIKKNTMLFNRRFAEGEQYLKLSPTFEIIEEGKAFYWQERSVFNIVLPIVEMLKQKYPKITKNELYGVKGLVSMLVPIQRAYNAIKNAGIEKIKMTPVLVVEDGSIDIDNVEEEGLAPGKVLVYRQGAQQPNTLRVDTVSETFLQQQEESVMRDFQAIINAFMGKMELKYGVVTQ